MTSGRESPVGGPTSPPPARRTSDVHRSGALAVRDPRPHLLVAQYLGPPPFGFADEHGVRLRRVIAERDQRLGERPAAGARPRGVVDGEACSEDLAGFGGEDLP